MSAFLRGERIAERYEVRRELAHGAQGRVLEVRNETTGHIMCLKVFAESANGSAKEAHNRIRREAQLTASLNHPNTVRVFDFGELPDGGFFIGMERVVGETLEQRLATLRADHETMSEAAVLNVASAVLGSLAEAHSCGLIHRDLKPANIMLQPIAGTDEAVRVLDFGLVLEQWGDKQLTGRHGGTMAYCSPEQLRGNWLDGRSDLFALGVIMLEALTGLRTDFALSVACNDKAYQAECEAEIQRALSRGISAPTAAILRRLLSASPNFRFRSAGEMLTAVRQAQGFGSQPDVGTAPAPSVLVPSRGDARPGDRPELTTSSFDFDVSWDSHRPTTSDAGALRANPRPHGAPAKGDAAIDDELERLSTQTEPSSAPGDNALPFPENTWQLVDKKMVADAMAIIGQRRRRHETVTAPYEVEPQAKAEKDDSPTPERGAQRR